MVKLTAELIDSSRQYLNPVRDRELNLRGYKIPAVENLGATYDQFDTIDFTDNDLKKLDNFPLLNRLKCILCSNNRISNIDSKLCEMLPNLNTLIVMNNNLQQLGDLEPLVGLSKLEHLSLLGNPVTHEINYRLYVIHKIPQLRVLDFSRIRLKEREAAKKLFKSKKRATENKTED